eukprot:7386613-Prymnesium_polylepis.2
MEKVEQRTSLAQVASSKQATQLSRHVTHNLISSYAELLHDQGSFATLCNAGGIQTYAAATL